ncbi:Protein EXORDIUM-like protein [Dioscorea alata]|uniref:Protein EXORDIUM-like protein n=1 Tax=Dioscorea alata TaxID=55571 RepID=A0ACB7VYH4_DIOAL|nr:Protein EXORDIUM-like protein [Dioscorea alata]
MAPLLLLFLSLLFHCSAATPTTARKLILVQQQPLVLQYHHGPLLTGNLTVRLLWYGSFSASHRAAISDFILSLSSSSSVPTPSVASWWSTTASYRGRPISLSLGPQLIDDQLSLGKSLSSSDLLTLASRTPHRSSITAILTSPDVTVEGFCSSRCATHSSAPTHPNRLRSVRFPYLWVGDSSNQCPGQCAWPFHQPIYGPQTPPLIPPNADVGIDGMIINLATVLAGAVTNPFQSGFYQGPAEAPLEAVTACPGVFGSGAYPGYPGRVLVDRSTGSSFNSYGINGRKYLLPSMWDPSTSQCATLV